MRMKLFVGNLRGDPNGIDLQDDVNAFLEQLEKGGKEVIRMNEVMNMKAEDCEWNEMVITVWYK